MTNKISATLSNRNSTVATVSNGNSNGEQRQQATGSNGKPQDKFILRFWAVFLLLPTAAALACILAVVLGYFYGQDNSWLFVLACFLFLVQGIVLPMQADCQDELKRLRSH